MSEIKALDKLREIAEKLDDAATRMSEHGFSPIAVKTSLLCDEIEAEIADNYMRLPVDADGVPIHVGDEIFGDCPSRKHVSGRVAYIGKNRFILGNVPFCLHGDYMHHVKPRTLTDVLADLFERKISVTDAEHEISELLGGDAE